MAEVIPPFDPIIPWLVWVLPMVGAVLTPLYSKAGSRFRDTVPAVFSLSSALLAASMLPAALAGGVLHHQVDWISSLGLSAGVQADPLSIIMANIVGWVSFLIMLYSIGYMNGEAGLVRYWFFMNFFIGGMQLIVLSDNLLQLFFGWEIVGLCSYGLIGFWHRDEVRHWVGRPGSKTLGISLSYPPSHAGMKAFITTKIGDVAFLIGLLLIFYATAVNGHPTFQYQKLIEDPSWVETLAGMNLFIPAAILIFGGAIGKSAQFPLHEWLPDAMAGPTAVSALIHAATMVKAGVFLVARMGPVFFLASAASATIDASYFFLFVAAIGAFTAFLAASQALVSTELKKVLAYSTVSQIGYMMLALGAAGLAVDFVSGITAGFFHLASHAVFKASLFMAAGWVIHAAGSRFMEDMGGFRKHMRITFISMLIAGAALAGVPPLSGFWSKDSILAVTLTIHDQTLGQLLFVAAGITALMTAFYTFRMLGMIFWGSSKPHAGTHDGGEAHEAPRIMWIPYAALAVGSIALGAVGPFFEEKLHELFAEDILHTLGGVPAASPGLNPLAVSVSLLALGIGGGLGYLGYIRRSLDTASILKSSRVLRSLHGFLENRWYINSIVYILFVNSTLSLAAGLHRRIESAGFDRLSQASAYASLAFSKVSDKFDVYVVDGAVNGLAKVSQLFSRIVRLIQSGITQSYVVAFALGILLLIVIILR